MRTLPWRLPFPGILIWAAVLFGFIFVFNFQVANNQQFIYLADSFLHGRLDFQAEHARFLTHEREGRMIWHDVAAWQNKNYWPLGPLPAVLLMPMVAIWGTGFLQGYVSFLLTILNFCLIYRLAQTFGHEEKSSLYLATAFVFGSTYVGVATFPVSWFFAQVVGTAATLLALYEYFCRTPKRWWLIGTYLGLATTTRLTLGLGAIFFIAMIALASDTKKLHKLTTLAAPMLLAVLLLMTYNYARFQNPWESGYNLQVVHPLHVAARQEGFFSLKHVPANLYFLLLRGPLAITQEPNSSVLKYPYWVADRWGMSILINTPILLYLLLYRKRDKIIHVAWITTGIMLIPILTFYGIGASQFGYRYVIDFLPFLFLALMAALPQDLPRSAKWVIVISSLFNAHLLFNFIF